MRGEHMSEKRERLKEQLLKNVDMIIAEIDKGNDIEVRRAAGPKGGIKVMVVNKKTIVNVSEE